MINGHIHCRERARVCGRTVWLNPGNISRVSRDDAIKAHVPAALQVTLDMHGAWCARRIVVPHKPFEEVFYEEVLDEEAPKGRVAGSSFVQGLGELASRRTQTGAGLVYFLEQNLQHMKPAVGRAIVELAKEVLPDEHPWKQQH